MVEFGARSGRTSRLRSMLSRRTNSAGTKICYCWIHSLPDELISDILVAVIAPRSRSTRAEEGLPEQLDKAALDFPVLAQLVCKRWKAISLATPALWAVLHLTFGSTNTFVQRIERSGILPLQVYLELPSLDARVVVTPPSELRDLIRVAVPALRKHANRIQTLDIKRGSNIERVYSWLEDLIINLKNVTQFTIHGGISVPEEQYLQLVLVNPRLHTLHVDTFHPDWAHVEAPTSVKELRVFRARGRFPVMDLWGFVAALQTFSHLRVLELENQPVLVRTGSAHGTIQPAVLEGLERLVLKGFAKHRLQWIFDLVEAPHLKSLLVESDRGSTSTLADYPLPFPSLERLDIKADPLFALQMAKRVSTIKQLGFFHEDMADVGKKLDQPFNRLVSHWKTLPNPPPLEILHTKGVRLSSLLSLVNHPAETKLPIREISVHYTDAFLSESSKKFGQQIQDLERLRTLVDASVWGISNEAREARGAVHSFEQEKEWAVTFRIKV